MRDQVQFSGIHDVNETSSRVFKFVSIALIFAFLKIIITLIQGVYLSAILISGMFVSMVAILWINKKMYGTITKISIVLVVSVFFMFITFAEGRNTGGYLYFLPALFAIPYIINNSKNYKWEIAIYFSVLLSCFAIVLLFGDEKSTWQYISDELYQNMFLTNCFITISLCAIFSYLSIHLERKYALALLIQKNKAEDAMNARTRFLSNMGHELRTPLNGIIGATALIRNGATLPEQEKYLDILKFCSDHMLGMVNDILDYHKIEQDKFELHPTICNLKQILTQSILPFQDRIEEKHLDLKLSIDEQLNENVLTDDIRLIQVINNLVSNALKFTDTGHILLSAKLESLQEEKMTVTISVQDTGIGIKEELQKKIFESFWQVHSQSTRKYGGTGLGLSISQKLLALMNSKLQLESEAGKGSRFYFNITFPIVKANQDPGIPPHEPSNLSGYRILVAEDNLINMMVVKKILEDWQAEVVGCENGRIAIETLSRDDNFQLVLMDLEMPEMDGHAALKIIKQKHSHLPVFAFTAALMDNLMLNDLLEQGFTDCILKPFQPQQLLSKIIKSGLKKPHATAVNN